MMLLVIWKKKRNICEVWLLASLASQFCIIKISLIFSICISDFCSFALFYLRRRYWRRVMGQPLYKFGNPDGFFHLITRADVDIWPLKEPLLKILFADMIKCQNRNWDLGRFPHEDLEWFSFVSIWMVIFHPMYIDNYFVCWNISRGVERKYLWQAVWQMIVNPN